MSPTDPTVRADRLARWLSDDSLEPSPAHAVGSAFERLREATSADHLAQRFQQRALEDALLVASSQNAFQKEVARWFRPPLVERAAQGMRFVIEMLAPAPALSFVAAGAVERERPLAADSRVLLLSHGGLELSVTELWELPAGGAQAQNRSAALFREIASSLMLELRGNNRAPDSLRVVDATGQVLRPECIPVPRDRVALHVFNGIGPFRVTLSPVGHEPVEVELDVRRPAGR